MLFKRKNKKAEPFSSHQAPLSYPIGQAAQRLRISKRTLIRRAEAMGLEFDFDGRGRRVRADDIERLLSGGYNQNNSLGKAEALYTILDEADDPAVYNLELPQKIRVWHRLPSGKGTVLKGNLFCDESCGTVHQLIQQTYGPGEYVIRTIEHGVLSKRSYEVLIGGEPWVNKENKTEATKSTSFGANPQSKQEKQLSRWLAPSNLRWWWSCAKAQLLNRNCSLTPEDFIFARRSFKQYLDQLEEDEFELIIGFEAYEIFLTHVQRICQNQEQNDDDARLSDAPVEQETHLREMLEDIKADILKVEKEQSEQKLLLLGCLFGLLILLAPQLGQILEPILKQQGGGESDHQRPQNDSTRSGETTKADAAEKQSSSIIDDVLIPVDIGGDNGISAIIM